MATVETTPQNFSWYYSQLFVMLAYENLKHTVQYKKNPKLCFRRLFWLWLHCKLTTCFWVSYIISLDLNIPIYKERV